MSIFKIITLFAILGYFAMEAHAYCVYNNVRNPDDKHKTTYWLRQQPYNAGPNYFSYVLSISQINEILKLNTIRLGAFLKELWGLEKRPVVHTLILTVSDQQIKTMNCILWYVSDNSCFQLPLISNLEI